MRRDATAAEQLAAVGGQARGHGAAAPSGREECRRDPGSRSRTQVSPGHQHMPSKTGVIAHCVDVLCMCVVSRGVVVLVVDEGGGRLLQASSAGGSTDTTVGAYR
jgi:hypothetical protein